MQVNGKRSEAFAIEQSVRQGCPLSPLLYVIALETLHRRLRNEESNPALQGVTFAGRVRAKVSACVNDMTVFVSRRLDILAVKKAVLIKANVCVWVPGGVAIPCQGPSAGLTDPRCVVRARPPIEEKLVGGTC